MEVRKMQWELVVALVIAIPIILLAAYIWYLHNSGIYAASKEEVARQSRKKNAKNKKKLLQAQDYMDALAEAHKPYPLY